MHSELVKLLQCPVSGGRLYYNDNTEELICLDSALAYRIKDGIPILLKERARQITNDELKTLKEKFDSLLVS